jgi:hypothetical protein
MADLSATIEDLLRDPEPVRISTGRTRKSKGKNADEVLLVYPRIPTDVERDLILGAANRARRKLREKLSDPKSEEYQLLLDEPLRDADPETLRNLWISGRMMERAADLNLNSLEEREYVPEPEGDIIPAKATDAYEAEVEEAEARRENSLVQALTSVQRDLTEAAEKIDGEALLDAARPAHIETLVNREWTREWENQTLARCTYLDPDHTKPYFKTIAQVVRLRSTMPHGPRIVQQLANAHKGLLIAPEPSLGG